MSQNPLPPAGDPSWVGRAVLAVLAFEPDLDRANLLQLLSWWAHADKLNAEEAEQVVEQVRAHYGLWPAPTMERVAGATTEPEPDDEPTAELGRTIPPYGDLPESVRQFRAEQAEHYRREAEGGAA